MSEKTGEMRQLAGGLYFVATPIGNARDITLRALDILGAAEVIAAEDTRTARKLMEIHGISVSGRPMIAYHDHNGPSVRPRLLKLLQEGRSVAYVSEAGSPLVADPGFTLGRAAIAEGLPVYTAPGPSAVIAALTVSGLATDRFLFAGFLPATGSARRRALEDLADVPATLVFFESAKRLHKSLVDMRDVLGAGRRTAVCRELTKKFEEVLRGGLDELCQDLADRTLKGEIVVVVERTSGSVGETEMVQALERELKSLSLKDAVAKVSAELQLPRRQVYQTALNLGKNG